MNKTSPSIEVGWSTAVARAAGGSCSCLGFPPSLSPHALQGTKGEDTLFHSALVLFVRDGIGELETLHVWVPIGAGRGENRGVEEEKRSTVELRGGKRGNTRGGGERAREKH